MHAKGLTIFVIFKNLISQVHEIVKNNFVFGFLKVSIK